LSGSKNHNAARDKARASALSLVSSASSSPSAGASASSRSLASCGPKSVANSKSLAHTMQWIGLSGVLRMVHTGYVLGVGFGWHSKHSVPPLMCTDTWAHRRARRASVRVGVIRARRRA
jgi:hypothetical protein